MKINEFFFWLRGYLELISCENIFDLNKLIFSLTQIKMILNQIKVVENTYEKLKLSVNDKDFISVRTFCQLILEEPDLLSKLCPKIIDITENKIKHFNKSPSHLHYG